MTTSQSEIKSLRKRPLFFVSLIIAEAITLALSIGPLISTPWWTGFRGYFAHDQLSYAAIASNVANGDFSFVEPLTQTGVSHYPSFWYYFIGLVSWLTHLPLHLVWTILGLAILSAAVLIVGTIAARISNKAWAPLLPALALLSGTLAIETSQYWYTPLESHAVLWAPYASIFTLNGEIAGICIAVITLSLLVDALFKQDQIQPHKTPRTPLLIVAFLIGLLANIQTYTFFSVVLVVAIFITARDLARHPSRARAYATIAFGAVILLMGKEISKTLGPLPLIGLLLISMAPTLIPAAWRAKRFAIPALLIAGVAASPQIIRTAIGIVNEDPFLLYREASSTNLGILEPATLTASTVWILLFITVGIGLWRSHQASLSALTIALGLGFIIMPANDIWGFNQEPYRQWIQFAILSALLLMIPLTYAFSRFKGFAREHKALFLISLTLTATAWGLGLKDFQGFWDFAKQQGVIDVTDTRAVAIQELTKNTSGIVLGTQCMDPLVFKLIAQTPVPYFNLGLAWPREKPNFDTFLDPGTTQPNNPLTLQNANVQWVVTDSSCATEWQFPIDQRVVKAAEVEYLTTVSPATLTLWRVNPR
jgi:hypothetical protein